MQAGAATKAGAIRQMLRRRSASSFDEWATNFAAWISRTTIRAIPKTNAPDVNAVGSAVAATSMAAIAAMTTASCRTLVVSKVLISHV